MTSALSTENLGFGWRFLLALELSIYFVKEVILANFHVARLVFTANRRLTPAFISVPIAVSSDWGLVTLANMITLTPGTLSVDIAADRKNLLVHVIHSENPDQVVRDIQRGFQRRIVAIFDGRRERE